MRTGTYTASDTESVEGEDDTDTGKKCGGETGGGAVGGRRKRAAELIDGSGLVGEAKKSRGGDYSKAKAGDLWMHTIN